MGPLIIVSNRTPGAKTAAGGLAVALRKVLAEQSGFWFGWSGKFDKSQNDSAGDDEVPAAEFKSVGGLDVGTIDLPKHEYEGYYEGYSNSVLWPAFHHRLDLVRIDPGAYEAYLKVNRRFAKALLPHIGPDHTIWIHDYHMIPMGRELRRLGVTNKIGFFLHIPLPEPETFSAVPHQHDLLNCLAAYDRVGLQAQRDLEALRHQGSAIDLPSMTTPPSETSAVAFSNADAYPIGTDPAAFRRLSGQASAKRTAQLVKDSISGRALVLGVDRLDYSKGLPERIAAYETLLEHYPEWRRRVHMLQIAPPSRDTIAEYEHIAEQLDIACGRVMGKFSEPDWTPLNYVKRAYPQSALAGLYAAADVALVTPLRDGMNLVAHEFVACQDPENPGVLILSRFAGAAEILPEALLVNPHNAEEMANAINFALEMPRGERMRRWHALNESVDVHNVDNWASSFLEALEAAPGWQDRSGQNAPRFESYPPGTVAAPWRAAE